MAFTTKKLDVSASERLIKLYKKTYLDILAEIDSQTDFTQARRSVLLAKITAQLKTMGNEAQKWVETEIPKQYYTGVNLANSQLKEMAKKTNIDLTKQIIATTQYNKQAVEALVSDTSEAFAQALTGVGRSAKVLTGQASQREIRERIASGIVSGEARKDIVNSIKAVIKDKGLEALRDRGGKTWTIDTYADMLVRTKMLEARNTGTVNTMLANGNDLVQVSINQSDHDVCADWEGEILSLTGETDGYPTVDDAEADGLWHPNCKHTINAINLDLAEKTYGYNSDTGEYEQGLTEKGQENNQES